jgi:hypothetical protein
VAPSCMKHAIDDINPEFKDGPLIQNKPHISDIFKDIPTTFYLTEINILTFDDNGYFNFDWDNLSQILVQPQFSTLRRVSVIIKLRPGYYIRKDYILKQMSDLHGRGILNIIETYYSIMSPSWFTPSQENPLIQNGQCSVILSSGHQA